MKGSIEQIMADKVRLDLVVASSHVNANDWVLILDKAKYLDLKKGETLIQQGKQTCDGFPDFGR